MGLKGVVKRNGKNLYLKNDLKNPDSRLIYERVCMYCGCDFLANRKTSIYCCNSHRISDFRLKRKKEEINVFKKAVIDKIKDGTFSTKDAKFLFGVGQIGNKRK